jgi:hypothetical protein
VVPSTVLVRVLHVLLCEGKLAIECPDLGLLAAAAAALPCLLAPLRWAGAHIPVKPLGIPTEELLQCPNPFVIGVLTAGDGSSSTRPRPSNAPEDVAVLTLGGGTSAALRCGDWVRGVDLPGSQTLAAQLDRALGGSDPPPHATQGGGSSSGGSGGSGMGVCGARGNSKRGAAACARAFALGLTACELAAVARTRGVLSSYVAALVGDAEAAWASYGEVNDTTKGTKASQGAAIGGGGGVVEAHVCPRPSSSPLPLSCFVCCYILLICLSEFEFIPERFLEPRQTALALQTELAHSQMFHTFIASFKQKGEAAREEGHG